MDTSETYIKMCDCEEIQKDIGEVGGTFIGNSILYHVAPTNQPHNRDGYYHITDHEEVRKCETCGTEEPYIHHTDVIWLPRQDQLQEILTSCYKYTFGTLLRGIHTFYFEELPDSSLPHSMEQLWLAFVMKERYGKVWDGEKWVNADI